MSSVLYEKRDGIAHITLNRPEKLNAIDASVEEGLREAWTRFRDDPEVRLAILSGNGEKAFCAGADLHDHVDGWVGGGPDLGRRALGDGFAGGITRGLHRTGKPIIAALHGLASGNACAPSSNRSPATTPRRWRMSATTS